MEQRAQSKKRYLSASYLTSGAVFYGTLLFFISRVFLLFQLFGDAYNRKQLDQAPPDGFTFLGIVGSLIVIGVIGLAFLLLVQNRQKKLRLKKGNFYLLLNVLFVAWGAINAVSNLVDMVVFFEFVYLLDFITAIVGIIVPSILLQLADRKQGIPRDTALYSCAIASTALTTLAALIVILFLRGGYKDTPFAFVRELIFRAGMLCFSIAGLMKAIKIRRELPEIVDAVIRETPKLKPKPESKAAASKQKAAANGKIECPDCGKKLEPGTLVCTRCGYDLSTPSLFDDEYEDEEPLAPESPMYDGPEYETEEEPPVPPPEPEAPPVRNDVCVRCGKHKPPFLSTCPYCGYFPGDTEEEQQRERDSSASGDRQTEPAGSEPRQERRCEHCGKRIPGGLSTCPYCGFHPADVRRAPEPAPDAIPDRLFDDEPEEEMIFCPRCDYEVPKSTQICPHCGFPFPEERQTARIPRPTGRIPRIPDPRHLNEKNSIDCPECGRRYSAARNVCPYCGYDIYND